MHRGAVHRADRPDRQAPIRSANRPDGRHGPYAGGGARQKTSVENYGRHWTEQVASLGILYGWAPADCWALSFDQQQLYIERGAELKHPKAEPGQDKGATFNATTTKDAPRGNLRKHQVVIDHRKGGLVEPAQTLVRQGRIDELIAQRQAVRDLYGAVTVTPTEEGYDVVIDN